MINAYQLALMIMLLPLASLGDIYGYKRINLCGLAVFTLASLGLRRLELADHAGGDARGTRRGRGRADERQRRADPLDLSARHARPGSRHQRLRRRHIRRRRAYGGRRQFWHVATWPWLFLVNLPLGVIALVLAPRMLPPNRRSHHRFDGLSAALNALTFGLFITCIDGFGHGESSSV